jgi:hypothetical protein
VHCCSRAAPEGYMKGVWRTASCIADQQQQHSGQAAQPHLTGKRSCSDEFKGVHICLLHVALCGSSNWCAAAHAAVRTAKQQGRTTVVCRSCRVACNACLLHSSSIIAQHERCCTPAVEFYDRSARVLLHSCSRITSSLSTSFVSMQC